MKNPNIKKRFVESSFYRVYHLIKKNPNIYLYTIILDFIFLALLISIGKYFGSFIPQDPQQIIALFKTQTNLLLFVFIYPLLYYLFVIFIYSITKLSILNLIKSLYKKHKFTLKGLGKFYLLNILIFIIFFFVALIVLGILALILRRDFLKYVILILSIPFLFFIYSIINISHTLFIKLLNPKDSKGFRSEASKPFRKSKAFSKRLGNSKNFQSNIRKQTIKKSLNITFNKINKYGMFIIWNIILILIYLLFYNIIHLIFRFLIFTNKEILTAYGSTYLKIFNIVSIIFIYLIIAFNRIYFYERIDKNVLQ